MLIAEMLVSSSVSYIYGLRGQKKGLVYLGANMGVAQNLKGFEDKNLTGNNLICIKLVKNW